MPKRLPIATAMFVAGSAPAFAHLDPVEHGSLLAGISHPLFGADHILAMLAVGLWASQVGGKALWAVPAAFVATMALGFAIAVSGLALPFVEPAILASVIALGLLVAMAAKLPAAASAAVVAIFALFHGHAHGGELGTAGAWQFAIGFAIATALLHASGVGLGAWISRFAPAITRVAGAATALLGLSLAFG